MERQTHNETVMGVGFLGFLIGLGVGAGIAFIFWRERFGKAYFELKEKWIETETLRKTEAQRLEEYKRQWGTIEEVLNKNFKSISLELYQANARSFLQLAEDGVQKYSKQAKDSLDGQKTLLEKTLEPLKNNLQAVEDKIDALEKLRSNAYVGLKEHIEQLNNMQIRLEGKTEELARSLRDPNARGRWGELQLKRVVEYAGMLQYVDFETQKTFNNGTLRPDMVVRLPNDRVVVVDAKSPQFELYLETLAGDNVQEESKALKACCQRIREVITKLGSKDYGASVDFSADFVVLFFPGEWLFSRTLNVDAELIQYASQNNVVFATPTTLIALLKAIHYGWRQNEMVKEVKEIGRLGGELYERMVTFGDYFQDLRKHLGKTIDTYNQLLGSLENRILPAADRLKSFSKKNNTFQLPESLPVNLREPK